MKKRFILNKVLMSLFFFCFVITGCDTFDVGVKDFFERYTETAAIGSHELDGTYPTNEVGITCIDCKSNHTIKVTLRNPKNKPLHIIYDFDIQKMNPWYDSENGLTFDMIEEYNGYYNFQSRSLTDDNTEYLITFDKSFLEKIDKKNYKNRNDAIVSNDEKNISGTIRVFDDLTGMEFLSYHVDLSANTTPPDIKNACLNINNSLEDIAQNQELADSTVYYLCFKLPFFADNSVHKNDTHILIINNTKYYMKHQNNNISFYYDEQCSQLTSQFGTECNFALHEAVEGGYVFPSEVPDGYVNVFYNTLDYYSEGTHSYNVKLIDDSGLYKEVVATNTTYKLTEPSFSPAETNVAANDDGTYTVWISHDKKAVAGEENIYVGDVDVDYEVTQTDAGGNSTLIKHGTFNTAQTNSYPVKIPYGKTYAVKATARRLGQVENSAEKTGIKIQRNGKYFVKSNGDDATGLGTYEKPFGTIQKCINTIKNQIDDFGSVLSGGYEINLLSDITRTSQEFSDLNLIDLTFTGYTNDQNIVIPSGTQAFNIEIKGYNGVQRTISAAGFGRGLICYNGAVSTAVTLTIKNIDFINGSLGTYAGSGIFLQSAVLNLYDVNIKNNEITDTSAGGGGLYINQGGICNFYSGSITGNIIKGSGGAVYSKGTLTLGSSTSTVYITGNSQIGNGAVYVDPSSSLKIYDAVIKDNITVVSEEVNKKGNLYIAKDNSDNSISKLQILGSLKNSDIGLTIEKQPEAENSVVITDGYGANAKSFDGDIPTKRFFLDDNADNKLSYKNVSSSTEIAFAKNTNPVTAETPYLTSSHYIKLVDGNETVRKSNYLNLIEFGKVNKIKFNFVDSSESSVSNWSCKLMTATDEMTYGKYYTVDKNIITLNANIPEDVYYLDVTAYIDSEHPYTERFRLLPNDLGNCINSRPAGGTYRISKSSELEMLRDWVNTGGYVNPSYETTFVLTNDVVLPGTDSIGVFYGSSHTTSYCFNGVFDGNGHTIDNRTGYSLFAFAAGEIKNLTVVCNYGAGIVKPTQSGSVYEAGGIVAWAVKNLKITNCVNNCNIDIPSSGGTGSTYVGGIAAGIASSTNVNLTITNCINNGSVKSCQYAGGIAGIGPLTQSNDLTIKNCTNNGQVTGSFAGGISGTNGNIKNCVNYGDVIASQVSTHTGGVVSRIRFVNSTQNIKMYNCINYGEVKLNSGSANNNTYIGQIIGYIQNATGALSIDRCYYMQSGTPSAAVGYNNPGASTDKIYPCRIIDSKTQLSSVSTSNGIIDILNSPPQGEEGYLQWIYDSDGRVKLNYEGVGKWLK